MKKLLAGGIFLLIPFLLLAENNMLENYIEQGLKNNLALKQKQFSLDKSLYALHEARGMFLPSVGIEARYTRAGGGREIEFPVGTLMNPVYSTLNQLLGVLGQPAQFPTDLEDEIIPFLREEEHETKIRLVQPIFQPAIYFNYKIKKKLRDAQQAEVELFEQQLITDITTAYFSYLKTCEVVKIYQKTKVLLDENLRVSEKLFESHKATKEVVFRAQAEIASLEQQQAEAEKNKKLAAAYFNFLLNEPFSKQIEIIKTAAPTIQPVIPLIEAQQIARQNRVEFQQVQMGMAAARNGVRLSKTKFLPGLVGVVDYGFQGEEYKFTKDDDYWMASAVLEWNLFNGFQDKAKHQQAVADLNQLETQFIELEKQINLQVQEALDNLVVGQKSMQAAEDQLRSARSSFEIINKKYKEGMTPQIEFLNARTMLTNAEVNQTVVQYDYRIKQAQFQHILGKAGK
jgi:outer membrane protein